MNFKPIFENRYDAGRQLAQQLTAYANKSVVVLAIPNGGVPIGLELALALNSDFDVVISRKIPIPLQPEAGFGAIADDGTIILNDALVSKLGLTDSQIEYEANRVRMEIKRRTNLYRGDRQLTRVNGRTVIITDDGLASGFTMIAAVESIRHRAPKEIIVAVPTASTGAVVQVKKHADKLVAVAMGDPPYSVARYYRHWYDLKKDEVLKCLETWRKHQLDHWN